MKVSVSVSTSKFWSRPSLVSLFFMLMPLDIEFDRLGLQLMVMTMVVLVMIMVVLVMTMVVLVMTMMVVINCGGCGGWMFDPVHYGLTG